MTRTLLVAIALLVSGQLLDRILAVVDGAPITQSDVRAAMQLGLVQPRGSNDPVGDAVNALVERRLVLEEVDRYAPPDPTEADITRRLDEIKKRVGPRFDSELTDSGLTEDLLRREIRNDLRIDAYLQQRFGTSQPSDERTAMVREWLSGLRRRANVTVLPR